MNNELENNSNQLKKKLGNTPTFSVPENYMDGIEDDFLYLKEIGHNLEQLNIISNFRFDLSEVANRDYYTGIVFKAYTKDIDSAIASGGRYDELISSFGESVPSVGFSILLRKIEPIITDERFNPPEITIIESQCDFIEAYKKAELLRKNGKSAIIKGVQ